MKKAYKILVCGDSAVTVEFSSEISEEINAKVIRLASEIEKMNAAGVEDVIPTYRSLTVCYDPSILTYKETVKLIKRAASKKSGAAAEKSRIFRIPVAYGSEFGPDLESVARKAGIEPIEVVRRHVSRDYRIYMLGFLPGFPYLSGMDSSIETPRLSTPRISIPAGSVGIGGSQTGIYPVASPGGWNIIGRTPLKLYDPDKDSPVIYRAGDKIRFIPIVRAEYEDIKRRVEEGSYDIKREVELVD